MNPTSMGIGRTKRVGEAIVTRLARDRWRVVALGVAADFAQAWQVEEYLAAVNGEQGEEAEAESFSDLLPVAGSGGAMAPPCLTCGGAAVAFVRARDGYLMCANGHRWGSSSDVVRFADKGKGGQFKKGGGRVEASPEDKAKAAEIATAAKDLKSDSVEDQKKAAALVGDEYSKDVDHVRGAQDQEVTAQQMAAARAHDAKAAKPKAHAPLVAALTELKDTGTAAIGASTDGLKGKALAKAKLANAAALTNVKAALAKAGEKDYAVIRNADGSFKVQLADKKAATFDPDFSATEELVGSQYGRGVKVFQPGPESAEVRAQKVEDRKAKLADAAKKISEEYSAMTQPLTFDEKIAKLKARRGKVERFYEMAARYGRAWAQSAVDNRPFGTPIADLGFLLPSLAAIKTEFVRREGRGRAAYEVSDAEADAFVAAAKAELASSAALGLSEHAAPVRFDAGLASRLASLARIPVHLADAALYALAGVSDSSADALAKLIEGKRSSNAAQQIVDALRAAYDNALRVAGGKEPTRAEFLANVSGANVTGLVSAALRGIGMGYAEDGEEISARIRRQREVEEAARFEGLWQRLMRDEIAIVASLSEADARAVIARLDAAPGDNPRVRAAIRARFGFGGEATYVTTAYAELAAQLPDAARDWLENARRAGSASERREHLRECERRAGDQAPLVAAFRAQLAMRKNFKEADLAAAEAVVLAHPDGASMWPRVKDYLAGVAVAGAATAATLTAGLVALAIPVALATAVAATVLGQMAATVAPMLGMTEKGKRALAFARRKKAVEVVEEVVEKVPEARPWVTTISRILLAGMVATPQIAAALTGAGVPFVIAHAIASAATAALGIGSGLWTEGAEPERFSLGARLASAARIPVHLVDAALNVGALASWAALTPAMRAVDLAATGGGGALSEAGPIGSDLMVKEIGGALSSAYASLRVALGREPTQQEFAEAAREPNGLVASALRALGMFSERFFDPTNWPPTRDEALQVLRDAATNPDLAPGQRRVVADALAKLEGGATLDASAEKKLLALGLKARHRGASLTDLAALTDYLAAGMFAFGETQRFDEQTDTMFAALRAALPSWSVPPSGEYGALFYSQPFAHAKLRVVTEGYGAYIVGSSWIGRTDPVTGRTVSVGGGGGQTKLRSVDEAVVWARAAMSRVDGYSPSGYSADLPLWRFFDENNVVAPLVSVLALAKRLGAATYTGSYSIASDWKGTQLKVDASRAAAPQIEAEARAQGNRVQVFPGEDFDGSVIWIDAPSKYRERFAMISAGEEYLTRDEWKAKRAAAGQPVAENPVGEFLSDAAELGVRWAGSGIKGLATVGAALARASGSTLAGIAAAPFAHAHAIVKEALRGTRRDVDAAKALVASGEVARALGVLGLPPIDGSGYSEHDLAVVPGSGTTGSPLCPPDTTKYGAFGTKTPMDWVMFAPFFALWRLDELARGAIWDGLSAAGQAVVARLSSALSSGADPEAVAAAAEADPELGRKLPRRDARGRFLPAGFVEMYVERFDADPEAERELERVLRPVDSDLWATVKGRAGMLWRQILATGSVGAALAATGVPFVPGLLATGAASMLASWANLMYTRRKEARENASPGEPTGRLLGVFAEPPAKPVKLRLKPAVRARVFKERLALA